MRLALCQINPTIGDLEANGALIGAFVESARKMGADLVVFPELALSGYPPKDLLLQEGFVGACASAAGRVGAAHSTGVTLVFGVPLPASGEPAGVEQRVTNSLLVFRDGKELARYDKRLLPTYDVFDEDRYFVPGERATVIDVRGVRVGLSICEDLWRGEDVGFASRYADAEDPVAALVRAGARVIVNPSASPFRLGMGARHRALLRAHATRHGVTVAAVNQVGGNDELIFDGSACVVAPDGSLAAAGPSFEEGVTVVDIDARGNASRAGRVVDALVMMPAEEALFRALVLGVRDYCRKTGFTTAVLGLSGGIDSAVVAVLASAALKPGNVYGVSLPSRYSSSGSKDDANTLALALGMGFSTVPIEEGFLVLERTLAASFAGRAADVTEENLQSRLRGTILMALSNKFGRLLLTTGNKSELAVGYCTLYGDMNGGLAVISDVTKMMVYRLARWMNTHWRSLGIEGLKGPPIPDASLTKAPSAELRPNQTDQDSLPAYEMLDEIVERYVERREHPSSIARAMGGVTDAATVARMVRLIDGAEFKRKQAAIGLKVTGVAFGSGRRVPIAQRWRPGV